MLENLRSKLELMKAYAECQCKEGINRRSAMLKRVVFETKEEVKRLKEEVLRDDTRHFKANCTN